MTDLDKELENTITIIQLFNKLLSDNKNIRIIAQRINNSKIDYKFIHNRERINVIPISLIDLANKENIFKLNRFSGTKKEAIEYVTAIIKMNLQYLQLIRLNLIKLRKGE